MKRKYIFRSERLGFRNWREADLPEFAEINADPEVMKHFPKLLTQKETAEFIKRLEEHYERHGYTYFACDVLSTGNFIGFIGLAYQDYQAECNPATDIGWRLKKSAWGKGYATEGAKRCLDYAFKDLQLKKVMSTCTLSNIKSAHIMKKLGMLKKGEFYHPKLKDYPKYEECLWYEIINENNTALAPPESH